MKVFIAGARSVKELDSFAVSKMRSIYDKGYDVIIGDCYGVDAAVQRYYAGLGYRSVTVYASNGVARNNIGKWEVRNVEVPTGVRGFEFYQKKDVAMADDADCGFMIWDGESRGTLSNIVRLAHNGKRALIYLPAEHRALVVKNDEDIGNMMENCSGRARELYSEIVRRAGKQGVTQLSML